MGFAVVIQRSVLGGSTNVVLDLSRFCDKVEEAPKEVILFPQRGKIIDLLNVLMRLQIPYDVRGTREISGSSDAQNPD